MTETSSRVLHWVTIVCCVLLGLVMLSVLHRIGIFRLLLVFFLVVVVAATSLARHVLSSPNQKGTP